MSLHVTVLLDVLFAAKTVKVITVGNVNIPVEVNKDCLSTVLTV